MRPLWETRPVLEPGIAHGIVRTAATEDAGSGAVRSVVFELGFLSAVSHEAFAEPASPGAVEFESRSVRDALPIVAPRVAVIETFANTPVPGWRPGWHSSTRLSIGAVP